MFPPKPWTAFLEAHHWYFLYFIFVVWETDNIFQLQNGNLNISIILLIALK